VYSFGLSLWEVFNNKLAFGDWNHLCSFREVHISLALLLLAISPLLSLASISKALVEKDLRPELSDKAPTTVNRLVASCWAHDPDDRPTMVEVFLSFPPQKAHLLIRRTINQSGGGQLDQHH